MESAFEPFGVISEQEDESLVLRVRGELDLATAPEFKGAVETAIQSDALRIVIDLDGLSFIDSRGISALISASAASQQEHDRLEFRGARGQVQRILAMTGVGAALKPAG